MHRDKTKYLTSANVKFSHLLEIVMCVMDIFLILVKFGSFAGQLGDGATMYIGEIKNNDKHIEIQFKGAGKFGFITKNVNI